MRIPPPKTIEDFAPPPLPPPQRINDLEDGHDAGWLHANGMGRPDVTKLAPINPSSSLFGGHPPPEPIPRIERMSLDESIGRSMVEFSNENRASQRRRPKLSELLFNTFLRTNVSRAFPPFPVLLEGSIY